MHTSTGLAAGAPPTKGGRNLQAPRSCNTITSDNAPEPFLRRRPRRLAWADRAGDLAQGASRPHIAPSIAVDVADMQPIDRVVPPEIPHLAKRKAPASSGAASHPTAPSAPCGAPQPAGVPAPSLVNSFQVTAQHMGLCNHIPTKSRLFMSHKPVQRQHTRCPSDSVHRDGAPPLCPAPCPRHTRSMRSLPPWPNTYLPPFLCAAGEPASLSGGQ